jgi:hypothetical protein
MSTLSVLQRPRTEEQRRRECFVLVSSDLETCAESIRRRGGLKTIQWILVERRVILGAGIDAEVIHPRCSFLLSKHEIRLQVSTASGSSQYGLSRFQSRSNVQQTKYSRRWPQSTPFVLLRLLSLLSLGNRVVSIPHLTDVGRCGDTGAAGTRSSTLVMDSRSGRYISGQGKGVGERGGEQSGSEKRCGEASCCCGC